jgi:hypothetical protein
LIGCSLQELSRGQFPGFTLQSSTSATSAYTLAIPATILTIITTLTTVKVLKLLTIHILGCWLALQLLLQVAPLYAVLPLALSLRKFGYSGNLFA